MNRLAGLPELPQIAAVRIAGRLGMSFFLGYLRIVGEDHDLLDGLILLAIGQANVEHLDREPDPRDQHGDIDDPPSETALRPITVNALAATLRLPFETVRRRVGRLSSTGDCVLVKRGAMLPPRTWASQRWRFRAFTVHQQARNLYLALRDLGVLRPLATRAASRRIPLLALERMAASYALRQLNSLSARLKDPALGLLLIHVIRASTDHLDDTYAEFAEHDDLIGDSLRRPAPIALLASRMGAPYETIRRHSQQLLKDGWIARDSAGGFYLTREMLRAEHWAEARRENVVNLNRLMSSLGEAGILSTWQGSGAPATPIPRRGRMELEIC